MGIFGRKKKKPQNDFDDDEGGDDGPRDEEGPGPMGGGPSGMGGGSDDNPYADDPAHKHLVKLLDTNGLVRHRRAFIRNSVYTVEHAKKLDAGKLEKIGVFLEADRKKLLRIFKDAETVESTVDAERAKEKEAMEEPPKKKEKKEKKDKKKKKDDEDEDDGKKSKKGKKDGSKKEKSKKGKKDRKKERGDDEGDDEDEDGGKKSKKSKRDKGKKSKNGKSEDEGEESAAEKKSKKPKKEQGKKGKKDAKSDAEDDLDLEMEEEEAKAKKSKRDKGKKSKKEPEDLDDFEGLEVGEDDGKKSKKKGKDRSKTKPKGKNSKKDDDFDDLGMDEEMGGKGDETETDALADLDKELEEAEATAKKNEKPGKPKPKKEKPVKVEEPEAPPAEMKTQSSSEHVTETPEEPKEGPIERKMSHGDQALKLLNAKLGQQGKRRSQSRRQSAKSRQSTGTIDEDEELWWKSLDKPSNASKKMTSESETETTSESEKFASKGAKAKARKTLKVKPEFGTKLEYITDEENNVLQNFRQGKTKRKTRQTPPPPATRQVPTYNPTAFNPYAPPPIPPKASENAATQEPNLQPPGQATTAGQQIQPPVPPNYVVPQPWGYYPPPQMYYTDEEDEVSDGSVGEYSKYKYYKDKYNERKKKKAQKKHEIRQQLVKQKSRPKTKRKPSDDASFKPKRQASEKLYVDLKKEDALPTDKDLRRRKRSDGNRVDDREVNASENEAEPQRFGNDDYYFNFAHQKNATVRMGRKGADEMKSERKVNYFQTPKDGSGYESDTELYVMRRKLAEVGASKFYPLLVKNGILSLKNCDLQKLEQLPIASRSQKKALIRTLLELRKGSRNIKKRTFHAFSDSETEGLTLASESDGSGLKSALKKKRNTSKQKSTKNRHYFSLASEIESDPEPDHVKAGPIAPEPAKVDDDKKSVKFDLDDEDEISLPSYSEGNGSESDLSLDPDYSD